MKAECAPILATKRESGVGGVTMEANFYMLGRRLRFGGAKKRKLMIFRNGWGRIEERYMDEHTILSQGHDVRIRARFDHYDFKSVGHFASKLVWYSGREVMDVLGARGEEDLQNAGIRRTRKLKTGLYYRLPRFFRVLCVFIFRYIFQLGFLDGAPGLIYHFMYSFMYRFLVDAKLYEAQKTGKYDTTGHRAGGEGLMRVLHVFTVPVTRNGITMFALQRLPGLRAAGAAVGFVAPGEVEALAARGDRGGGGAAVRSAAKAAGPAYVRALASLVRREKYDILHAHGNSSSLFFRDARRLPRRLPRARAPQPQHHLQPHAAGQVAAPLLL